MNASFVFITDQATNFKHGINVNINFHFAISYY